MKSVKPCTGTSKRSRGEASTTASASSAMFAVDETSVDLIAVVDPSGGANDVDLTITLPLSLCAMMETFMTTQVVHG